jgi:phosphoglycerate kinase
MCFTFLAAKGLKVGNSLVELDWLDWAAEVMQKADRQGVILMLPGDVVTAHERTEPTETAIRTVEVIPDDEMGLDIGPATIDEYRKLINTARTVLWNGPMGVYEMSAFEHGTREIATAVAMNQKATTIIGGGDSITAISKYGYNDLVSFISTGGGALLELIEGKTLPGVAALEDHPGYRG